MITKRLLPLSGVVVGLFLYGCSAVTTPSPQSSAAAPVEPMNTPILEPSITPPSASAGATVDVVIQGFAFDPPSITIKAGDTVRWTNQDSVPHSIISDTGLWSSGDFGKGEQYSRVFDTPGTYTYHCGVHPNMKGEIVVTA